MSDDARFSPGAYLKDNRVTLVLGILCAACVAGMGLVLGVTAAGAGALACTVLIAFAIALTYGYMRKRYFYHDIQECVSSVERAYYTPSLVDRPDFLEGQILHDVSWAIAQADAEELANERETARANREFAETWAHEIKTPIAASKLMVRRMHGPDALTLRREIERIEDACDRILFNARVTSLSTDYRVQETNLSEVCANACKDLSALLIEKGALPSLDIPENVTVLADPHWLGFVLKQALSNAAKYGATNIAFTCENACNDQHAQTTLHIQDDGIGIPATEVPRVFDRAWSGTNGRRVSNSTGMGLYLAARACATMGLDLTVTSEQGAGTRLSITFPHDRTRANLTGL